MNFTMKILAVCVLLVAMMALALATEAPPQAEAAPVTEAPVQENEEEADDNSNEETESEDEEGEEAESTEGEKKHDVAKRSLCRCRCSGGGWRLYRKTYYRYFAQGRTWAQAQYHCRALGGNLASVHNGYEEIVIRAVARQRPAWIGFSDAQQERYWFWIDGTRFNYRNWCRGQPDNAGRKQHCATNKWGARNCWDDLHCTARLPYVCARRRR